MVCLSLSKNETVQMYFLGVEGGIKSRISRRVYCVNQQDMTPALPSNLQKRVPGAFPDFGRVGVTSVEEDKS